MTISNQQTRRAALGAIASLSALAVPAAAISAPSGSASPSAASPSHPDAALFALIAAARDLEHRGEEAFDAAIEATQRTEKVPPPEAFIVTEDDTRLWKLNAGDPFDESYLDGMRRTQMRRRDGDKNGHSSKYLPSFSSIFADAPNDATLSEKDRAIFARLIAGEAREDQLIAAHDQWNEARHEAKVRSGELDAWNRSDELVDEKRELWRRITMTPAQTVAGMMAKLALAAPNFDDDELADDEGTADGILASVAVDFNALKPALATI